jgi:hypothetical protein
MLNRRCVAGQAAFAAGALEGPLYYDKACWLIFWRSPCPRLNQLIHPYRGTQPLRAGITWRVEMSSNSGLHTDVDRAEAPGHSHESFILFTSGLDVTTPHRVGSQPR